MTEIVNPEIFAKADELAVSFASARPFRHVFIDDFFGSEFCQQIVSDFPVFDHEVAKNEMGKVGKLHKSHVEQAGFAVLKSVRVPSLLIETGFISNPKEEKNLNSIVNQVLPYKPASI